MNRDKFIKKMATFFGAGEVGSMPGTVGTLFAIPLYVVIALMQYLPIFKSNDGRMLYYNFYFLFLVGFFFFASYISGEAEKIYREKDCQRIVIDEVFGYMTTMFLIKFHFVTIVMGFLFFRFFDIVKIYPINKAQDAPGGYGVVLDDFIAGVFANIMLAMLTVAIGF